MIFVSAQSLTSAPQSTEHQHSQTLVVPLQINGSTHPEQIPDEVAYRHFIVFACERRNSLPADTARRIYLLEQLRLSPADERTFVYSLDGVQEEIDALGWSEDHPLADATSRQQTFTRILDDKAAQLRTLLSAEGKGKLASWIDSHVKPNTQVFGGTR